MRASKGKVAITRVEFHGREGVSSTHRRVLSFKEALEVVKTDGNWPISNRCDRKEVHEFFGLEKVENPIKQESKKRRGKKNG